MKLVECIPNFSEGRDASKIKEITDSIESVDGITLLDVDPGSDTNRTVVTFIGNPEAVEKAAFLAIKTASRVIDMTQHNGTHSRIGATDVCPFVPINDFSDKDCIQLSKNVAFACKNDDLLITMCQKRKCVFPGGFRPHTGPGRAHMGPYGPEKSKQIDKKSLY